MAPINSKRTLRRDLLLAAGLLGLGAVVAIISLTEIKAYHLDQMAQATPEPSATPAESKPGGTRPTTPAPEPARPDVEAQKEGAKPALPPAPAEKVAPTMERK
ncbi:MULTISPECIES: hypothetical protein [Bradyrhizobium]|jgi:hypothetical protein|uniref:Uncharacterized protein n=1 Tax=Bradyrhizobium denitrificans TaxID=2734912 RepID=A0ABS5GES5_9BRAD|nr:MULTISPECIES: hypothetical protein [Bradyrhizobium]RTL98167.1 MAG: hypothetical protein EKK32_19315 [Bradyrhizobiaceae bacterium]MBR1139842.1 hypothetical protein [Bradyrhizobium denitrificans]MCL8487185.1 hypothetical protein [Bradyrhizobium denitrificans]MDU1493831.1 hypothetical protein [Bradyrhizobium sp.]MDU1545538.1 hypothetical protein [Bradyrhizobium sp.]